MEDIKLLEQILSQCVSKRLTPLLWGKHGIGKSMIVRSIFEEQGFEVIDLRLGQLEVGDLIGVPAQEYFCPMCNTKFGFSVKDAHCPICAQSKKMIPISGRTVWLPPSWFPQNGEKRLIFFDELNRGRLDVQQATFQIVLDRRIHTHKLPDNCGIVCACNPSGGDYYVEELDPALLDRFVNIKWNLDTRQWLRWAREKGIAQEIVDFIAVDGGKFLGNEPIKMEIDVQPSPRSYEFLSKLLDGVSKNHYQYWAEVSNAVLGEATSIAFMTSLKADQEKPVKAKEVFDKWDKVKDRVEAQVKAGKGDVRYDLLKATLDEIYDNLKDGKSKKLTDEQLVNVGGFLLTIPEDLSFSALKDIAPLDDVNQRLLMGPVHGKKLFDVLKKARREDMNK